MPGRVVVPLVMGGPDLSSRRGSALCVRNTVQHDFSEGASGAFMCFSENRRCVGVRGAPVWRLTHTMFCV